MGDGSELQGNVQRPEGPNRRFIKLRFPFGDLIALKTSLRDAEAETAGDPFYSVCLRLE